LNDRVKKSWLHVLCSLTFSGVLCGCSPSKAPDTIFFGGSILTVDGSDRVVEAIAIKDGVITQVGNEKDILLTADTSTERYNLNGKTIIPGFVASHEHPTLTAVFSSTVDVSGFKFDSSKQMWSHLKEQIANRQPGEWVYASGLDAVLMPDLISPNIQFLDQIAPNNPLFIISQTMHSFWANTAAFEQVSISKFTKDPGKGSYYGKDDNGDLNGFISEPAAAQPFLEPLKSPMAMVGKYQQALQSMVDSGYTSVASLGYNLPPFLAKYAASNNLSPRIRQFIYLHKDEMQYLPDSSINGDDFYRIVGVKLWYDGSPYTGTMDVTEPYLNNALTEKMGIKEGHSGEARMTDEDILQQINHYSKNDWQLAIHSQGDQSNNDLVSVIDKSLANNHGLTADKLKRNRVEHGLLLPKRLLNDFSRLGMTPSFHINHLYYYGDALSERIIGEQRANSLLPVRTAQELGLHPTLHADSPMFPADPFSLMQTAVTRKTRTGKTLGADQAISPQQALRTMTINAAWQLNMEHKLGSIEVGKLADLTLISANPYHLPPQQWSEIVVEGVWLQGEQSAQ
jgi:predicted amidohydrolase YtcJ